MKIPQRTKVYLSKLLIAIVIFLVSVVAMAFVFYLLGIRRNEYLLFACDVVLAFLSSFAADLIWRRIENRHKKA